MADLSRKLLMQLFVQLCVQLVVQIRIERAIQLVMYGGRRTPSLQYMGQTGHETQ